MPNDGWQVRPDTPGFGGSSSVIPSFVIRHSAFRHQGRLWLVLGICLAAATRLSAEEKGEAAAPFTRLFDTGANSREALAENEVAKRTGWTQVPEGDLTHEFKGDAVLANDKLTVVVRPRGPRVEVYSRTADGPKLRAAFGHLDWWSSVEGGPWQVKIVENTPSAVMVETNLWIEPKAFLRLRLTTGESILEMRPSENAKAVNLVTRSRYLVVPDFFADDMIFGRHAFKDLGIPAENFFLNLIEGGDALVMCVWQSGQQNVSATSTRFGPDALCSCAIDCVQGKSLWLAFLEGAGIWYGGGKTGTGTFSQSGEGASPRENKDGWKPPFPAKWRCTLGRAKGFGSSWDVDRGPEANQIRGRIDGPCVIYPIDRTQATPLTVYCPMDVLRNTLGVGPCQYILATEGLASETNPTPDQVMAWVEKEFKKNSGQGAADEIKERLSQMAEHLGRVRARIQQYGDLGADVLRLCREEPRRANLPHAFQSLPMAGDWMQGVVKRGLEAAGPPERPAQLAGQVVALIGKEKALAECERLGAELRAIGSAYGRLLSECRMQARWLKVRCPMVAAESPEAAELIAKIQARVRGVLQSK